MPLLTAGDTILKFTLSDINGASLSVLKIARLKFARYMGKEEPSYTVARNANSYIYYVCIMNFKLQQWKL